MNFVLMEFTIRRQKKEWDSGALKSFARYSSLGEDVPTATLHGGWGAEAGKDSWAMSAQAFDG